MMKTPAGTVEPVTIQPEGLQALLGLPGTTPTGLVIFAHGSGSGRLSPRNQHVAEGLRRAGLATLLLDLLTPDEEQNRANVFDIALLAKRLGSATRWAHRNASTADLPVGYFGASTGAGAALVAAAEPHNDVGAVVSRGGRPDLAGDALQHVHCPTLLIVGGNDGPVITMNEEALARLRGEKAIVIVPGAGHLFEEPGTLDQVMRHATQWFLDFLRPPVAADDMVFLDRKDAGQRLARALMRFKDLDPVILALPRGGVPVAFEVAEALDAPLDVVLVRKIGVPGHPEYGLGAVVDGPDPQLVLNEDVMRLVNPSADYIAKEQARQLVEIERRRTMYLKGRAALSVRGHTAIVVDDGIATGGTIKAVLRALSRVGAARIVLAVPVAPARTVADLRSLADEVICLAMPEPFHAVGLHYHDFDQTTDAEVVALLRRSETRHAATKAG